MENCRSARSSRTSFALVKVKLQIQTKLSMAETELEELRDTLKVRFAVLSAFDSTLINPQEKNAELAKLRGGR